MLRPLTARRRRGQLPGFMVCRGCGRVWDNLDTYEILRPGKAKGVVWCRPCAEPYLRSQDDRDRSAGNRP